jgi:TIR domain
MTLDEEIERAFRFFEEGRYQEVEPILASLAENRRVRAHPALYADVLLRLGTCEEVVDRIGDAVACWAAALRLLDAVRDVNPSLRRAIENELASYRDSPRAFLSYAHADAKVVHRMAKQLKRSGCRITLDQQDFVAGRSVAATIQHAMHAAPHYVIFWSASYNGRKWTMNELNLALRFLAANERVDGADGRRVVIVRLDSEPLPSDVEAMELLYIERGRMSAPRLAEEILRALRGLRHDILR